MDGQKHFVDCLGINEAGLRDQWRPGWNVGFIISLGCSHCYRASWSLGRSFPKSQTLGRRSVPLGSFHLCHRFISNFRRGHHLSDFRGLCELRRVSCGLSALMWSFSSWRAQYGNGFLPSRFCFWWTLRFCGGGFLDHFLWLAFGLCPGWSASSHRFVALFLHCAKW